MADNSYGMKGYLGVAQESSWGSQTAATDFLEILSESLTLEIDRFDVVNVVNRLQEPDDATGVKRISGDISFPAHPEPLGQFLLGALGIQSNTVVKSGVLHTHEFTLRNTDVSTASPQQPFSIEVGRDTSSTFAYVGMNMTTLEFNASPNQALNVTASFVGKDEQAVASQTPSFPSSPTGFFTFDTASISVGGSGNPRLEDFTLTIDQQLSGIPSLNASNLIQKIRREGPQTVRVSGSMAFEDPTEYNDFKNQTEQQWKVSFTKADSHQLIFDMPRVVYSSFPLGMDGRGRQIVSFNAIARYSTSSNQTIKVDLTNTTSGYG